MPPRSFAPRRRSIAQSFRCGGLRSPFVLGARGSLRSACALLPLLLGACSAGTPTPRLIALISVDTLRADRLGAHGSERGLTPELDRLAAESLVFEAAYAPASHTLPSVAALWTGRYPEELGVWSNASVLPAETETLADSLRAAGWRTQAVVSNWVLQRRAGLDRGFDDYDDRLPRVELGRPVPERRADETTQAALDALARCTAETAPCLLWVHYQDPHGPYTPRTPPSAAALARERALPDGPRELPLLASNFGRGGIPAYQALGGDREVASYRARYDAEIADLDREVGRLLAALRAHERASESAVVFTADHGEALGEEDLWFAHGESLHDALVRVPLWIQRPGHGAGRRSDVVSLVDLRPTLAALAGLPAQPVADPPAAGRDLLAVGAEQAASTPYLAALGGAEEPIFGLVDGDYKYLLSQHGDDTRGRLVLRSDESLELTAAAPQIAARLRDELEQAHRRFHRVERESRTELTPAEQQRLEALGYAAPSDPH